ncbi:hypothetical protein FHG87_007170 [Trinorchestia longiramus]|nr:hypothetical protein FHG87_007170 [Trinorchestia longiramus]
MESNQNTEKATKAKTRYCEECKASYSLQLFNTRGCNMDECRFCYFKQESAAIIEKQSRTIQELSRQLELNRQLELSRHLELNRQIDLLAGCLATIETNQKQHYEHELGLQSPETQPKQHLPTNNQPQHIKINAKRPNFYLKTKNRFSTLKDEIEGNALKNEMGNNINSTKEQITQISAEHNPQQIQSHTQPAGILKTIRKANKITDINLQNYNENKRTTKKKTKNRKKPLENMEFNDYIVGIWTLYCLKGTLALCYSSHKCRKRLLHLEATIPRSESPNFQSGAFIPYDPLLSSYSEASHVSSRDSYRRRPVVLDDESVGTECDSVTSVQAAANRVVLVVSDGESASDMDRVADELDVGASGFGGSRLVLTRNCSLL